MNKKRIKNLRTSVEGKALSREEFSYANKLRKRFRILETEQLETIARMVRIAAISVDANINRIHYHN